MKLRILNRKITADFLAATKASINLELARDPITMTYEQALAAFRNQVNQKFPPDISTSNNARTRRINQVIIGGSRENQGRGPGRGRGGRGRFGRGPWRGGRGGRGQRNGGRNRGNNYSGQRRGKEDARMVVRIDRTMVKVHPSYEFTD